MPTPPPVDFEDFRRRLGRVSTQEATDILATHSVAVCVETLLRHLTPPQVRFIVSDLRGRHPEWFVEGGS